MINLYDGNNYYRVILETDHTGFAPRSIFHNMSLSTEPNIWCWDGDQGNARRRVIYDGYKRNRKPLTKDIYAGFDLIKQILTYTPVIQTQVDGYEADDVIATLTRRFAGAGEQVCIFSNDYDFAQLAAEFPNRVFVGARSKAPVPSKLIRHYKALVGDPSDNIPGIAGFGEKAWSELGEDRIERLMLDLFNEDTINEEGLTPRVVNWLKIPENRQAIVNYWQIVGFFEIPDNELDDGMIVGVPNHEAANSLLERFML